MCRATLFAVSFYLILACIGSIFVVCGLLDRGLLSGLSRVAEVDHGDVPRLPNFQECLSALYHALVPHLPASLAAAVQSLLLTLKLFSVILVRCDLPECLTILGEAAHPVILPSDFPRLSLIGQFPKYHMLW